MRWMLGTTLAVLLVLGTAWPTTVEAQSCVTACAAATKFCGMRCEDVTSRPFRVCELECAQDYFVDCYTRCVETGEAHVPDPFEEDDEEGEEPGEC